MHITKKTIIKTSSIGGDRCKFVTKVIQDNSLVLVSIKKYVLTDRYEAIKELGFVLNRTFKDKVLISQEITFKSETFSKISIDVFVSQNVAFKVVSLGNNSK